MKRLGAGGPAALATVLALAFSLVVTPGVAHATDEVQDATASADVPAWAVDDGSEGGLTAQAELPATFDMRDKGWVTPVKQQSPWQTCWAFGATAAVESSILSDANLSYDTTGLDFSERHLAWFAVHPVTEAEDSAQAGEGAYPLEDGNRAFDTGGRNVLVTTLFAQGVGPVTEQEFPYRGVGADGVSHTKKPNYPEADFEKDKVTGTLMVIAELNGFIGTAEEMQTAGKAKLEDAAIKDKTTYEQELASAQQWVESLYESTEYFTADDWSIPATDANGASNRFKHAGLIIEDGNVLPEYWSGGELNAASMNAIKQELYRGRGVSIGYRADTARPGQVSDGTYINRETWSQYTFEKVGMDHAVCLVGWDDDYPASKFTHDVYLKDEYGQYKTDSDGHPVIDPESTAKTTPPGNGAWIVKNSWGSETDTKVDDLGNLTGGGTYGVRNSEGKATGYFYLSYYDKTILGPESMSFSSSLLGPTGQISIFQHDYMAATADFYKEGSSDVMSSANVFDLKEEYGDQVVVSVGGRTSDLTQRATFAIYQLNEGATDPTDGKLLYQTTRSFDYAGYHRVDLESPLAIRAGHKYSIVSTVFVTTESGEQTYSVSANQGVSKKIREWMKKQPAFKDSNLAYDQAVVNKGESFLYKDGAWVDWSDYIVGLPPIDDPDLNPAGPFERYIDALPIDNFSLKMYAEPATITLTHQEAVAPTCTEPGNTEYWYYDAIEATDTSEGLKLYYADEAGTKEISQADTVIAALGHDWGAWTKLDDGQHQRVCKRDSSHVETAAHEWGEGKVSKQPTATANGERTYTCAACGATKTESIPATGNASKGSLPRTGDASMAWPALIAMALGSVALLAAGLKLRMRAGRCRR